MELSKTGLSLIFNKGSNALKSLCCTKPQGLTTANLKLAPVLTKDTVELSNTAQKVLTPANNDLFEWAEKKPKLTFDTIDPESLCLVHITNYFPENAKIFSEKEHRQTTEGCKGIRATIHSSLNAPVVGDYWKNMEYAVIAPFADTLKNMKESKVIGGFPDDFMLIDEVALPKGTAIVKYNPEIPKEQFAVSDAFDGIKLIETSNPNMQDSANTVLKKLGFSSRSEAAKEWLNADDKELKLLSHIAGGNSTMSPEIMSQEGRFQSYIDNINNAGGMESVKTKYENQLKTLTDDNDPWGDIEESVLKELERLKAAEKCGDKMLKYEKAWPDFCSKYNYIIKAHHELEWARKYEFGTCAISALEDGNNNNWGSHKEIVLKVLSDAKKALPKDKDLGVDIDGIIKIVDKAETPAAANKMLKEELGLQPMKYAEEKINPDNLDSFLRLLYE